MEEDKRMIVELSSIAIQPMMLKTTPNDIKVNNRINRLRQGEVLVITVDSTGTLVDGYAAYIAYKKLGYTSCYVRIKEKGEVIRRASTNDLAELYESNGGICYICGRKCLSYKHRDKNDELCPTVDHVVPLSKNGPDNLYNKKLACKLCNTLKGQFTYSKALVQVIRMELRERGLI